MQPMLHHPVTRNVLPILFSPYTSTYEREVGSALAIWAQPMPSEFGS
jgi:hypothetical protein